MKVLIIGATGATGRILMGEALAQGQRSNSTGPHPVRGGPGRLPSQGVTRERAGPVLGRGGQYRTRRRDLGAGDAEHASHHPSLGESTQNIISAMKKHGAPPGLHNRHRNW